MDLHKKFLDLRNKKVWDVLTREADKLRPGLDWGQIQAKYDEEGKLVGLTSDDPELARWLARIVVQSV